MEDIRGEFAFKLLKVVTEQFAVYEENKIDTNDLSKLEMVVRFRFGVKPRTSIAAFALFELQYDKNIVVTIESGLYMELSGAAWEDMQVKKDKYKLEKEYAQHFAGMALGITRGILHSKTENTYLNQYPIPLIDASLYIPEDIEFDSMSHLN
ncbi:hypothetical protein AAEO56_04575 [Flavobacterium sp. DGU11]|uniref:Uncharacterized protein n=1 Tax=Flavobacterium arundinis TaxID=3139143 RepID=A0ABU9HTP1_9FLAO